MSGNVGIGTGTPSQTLDVQGNINIGVSGATTVSTYYNSTTRNQIVYTNNSSFEFFEGVNERMRFGAGSGNLLLGTTTDSARLTVKGSGTTSATTALLVQNSNASASLTVQDNSIVTIGEGYAKTISLNPDYLGNSAIIKGGYGNGYLRFGAVGVGNVTYLADNILNVGSIDVYGNYTSYGGNITHTLATGVFSVTSGSSTYFTISVQFQVQETLV